MGGTVYLRRGEQGVLTYHAPQEAQRAARADRIGQLVGLVQDDVARKCIYSKSSLAKRHGGTEGPFKMGINRLERLIDEAIVEGFLVQAPGHARHLVPTDKPTEIAKAKVVLRAMCIEAHKAAHGPEKS